MKVINLKSRIHCTDKSFLLHISQHNHWTMGWMTKESGFHSWQEQCVHTNSGPHPALYPVVTWNAFPGCTAAGA